MSPLITGLIIAGTLLGAFVIFIIFANKGAKEAGVAGKKEGGGLGQLLAGLTGR